MHFDYIAVGGRSVGSVSPGVGVQVDETEDESVHEKRNASRGAKRQKRCEVCIVLGRLSPEYDKDIRDVVHPGPVHESGFFISCRHEL